MASGYVKNNPISKYTSYAILMQKMKNITVFLAPFGKCLLTYSRVVANINEISVKRLHAFHLGVVRPGRLFIYLAFASLNSSGRASLSCKMICQIISFANKLQWKNKFIKWEKTTRDKKEVTRILSQSKICGQIYQAHARVTRSVNKTELGKKGTFSLTFTVNS